jgi:hypothetical protein
VGLILEVAIDALLIALDMDFILVNTIVTHQVDLQAQEALPRVQVDLEQFFYL